MRLVKLSESRYIDPDEVISAFVGHEASQWHVYVWLKSAEKTVRGNTYEAKADAIADLRTFVTKMNATEGKLKAELDEVLKEHAPSEG